MTFSIIVPAYNIEEFLPTCLESILPVIRPEDDILLSLRADASADRTNEIAREYAERSSNIHIVLQPGKGLSDARNCAMQQAKGDYLLFVDGDDFVYTDVLQGLLAKIRSGEYSADVIMTDYYTDRLSDGKVVLVKQIGERTLRGLDYLPEIMRRTSAYWPVWRNVYKAAYLRTHSLTFCDTTFNEDADFTARLYATEPDVLFANAPYYHYRRGREGSLMNEKALLRMTQNEEIFRRSITLLREKDSAWRQAAVTGMQYGYVMNFAILQEVPAKDRTQAIEVFYNWKNVLMPAADPWIRRFSQVLNVCGVRNMARILQLLKKIKRAR